MEAAELCNLIAGPTLLSRNSKIVLGKRRKTEGKRRREKERGGKRGRKNETCFTGPHKPRSKASSGSLTAIFG